MVNTIIFNIINLLIFSSIINIINDFVLEDFAIVNYHQLISREDSNDININTTTIDIIIAVIGNSYGRPDS